MKGERDRSLLGVGDAVQASVMERARVEPKHWKAYRVTAAGRVELGGIADPAPVGLERSQPDTAALAELDRELRRRDPAAWERDGMLVDALLAEMDADD
jgi:hypothetical protein